MIVKSFNTLFVGKVYHYLTKTASTNVFAAELLDSGNAIEGTLIVAGEQLQGRGYSGNKWVSEPGKNLLMSIILKPTFLPARQQFYLNQAVSLGVHDALKSRLRDIPFLKEMEYLKKHGSDLTIKWPNDIYYTDEKLAGILIENVLNGNFIKQSIIGIGLNVNQTKFPKGNGKPTSLALITEKEWDLAKLLENICSKIEARYLQLKNNQLSILQRDYMKVLYQLEDECWYKSDGKRFKATIVGLNPEGKLILDGKGGWKTYGFKEVEFG